MEQEDLLDSLKVCLMGLNAVLFVTVLAVYGMRQRASAAPQLGQAEAASVEANGVRKQALLVTAHPDDESMFFLPLLHSLADHSSHPTDDSKWDVHLLCLSRGNFDGLGEIRAKELVACAKFLGLQEDRVHVLEDDQLQDGMQTQWDAGHIAQIVLEFIEKHRINAVFTFDDYGVSGHLNHIAIYHGVCTAIEEQQARCTDNSGVKPVRGWALESTSIVRKYIGIVDALVSTWLPGSSDLAFVFICKPWWNYQAMALHHSQFVWYRRLFVMFSRYTFVNTFQPIGLLSSPANEALKKTQ